MLAILLALAAATPTSAAPQTLQQRFDAASTAVGQNRCEEGVRLLESLHDAPAVKKNAVLRGTVLAREAECLVLLDRVEEGEAAAREALNLLRPDSAVARSDIAYSRIAIGRALLNRHEYAAAAAELRLARDIGAPDARVKALLWLTYATMFDGGGEALQAADALRLAYAGTSTLDISQIVTLRARAQMNAGDVAGSYALLKAAALSQGKLGFGKTTVGEIITRGDLGLAALLAGDTKAAREYLAYSGAGHFDLPRAARMDLPACGDAGLTARDFAVVQFGIAQDGTVAGATPIYVSRGGATAAAVFSRAIENWSWNPEWLVKIPPAIRALNRVEVHCSNVVRAPDAMEPLRATAHAWMRAQGSKIDFDNADTLPIQPIRDILAKQRAAGGGTPLLPTLYALASNHAVGIKETKEFLGEAVTLLDTAKAPVEVRTLVLTQQAGMPTPTRRLTSTEWRRRTLDVLDDPRVAGSPSSRAAVRLRAVSSYESKDSAQRPLLDAIVADAGLDEASPLRAAALLRLSTLLASKGDLETARAAFARTGLSEQQCALIDLQPALVRSGVTSSSYPMDAVKWGFEGWVKLEYDVMSDGRPLNERVVVAYPPLVFRDAGKAIVGAQRFESRFRPAGGLACTGREQAINFVM